MRRVHMVSAAALLEVPWQMPSLDYISLMQLTMYLTHDYKELEKMYRLMCFNVFAHNRDDHSKNFSFVYDDGTDRWNLSPAYDLTWSNTYYGEHTTTVDGNGRNPGMRELVNVGTRAGLSKRKCVELAEQVREQTEELVKVWGDGQT